MTLAARFLNCTGYNMSVFPGWPTRLGITVLDDLMQNVTDQTVFTTTAIQGNAHVGLQYTGTSNHTILVRGKPGTSVMVSLETTDNRAIYTQLSIDISDCPPGMAYDSTMELCMCQNGGITTITCNQLTYQTFIFIGECISYSPVKKYGGQKTVIVTHCPFTTGLMAADQPYIPLQRHISELDKFCSNFSRTGKLCGECKKDYGIAVFSSTYECIPCNSTNIYKNWLQYLGVTLVPPTFLFLIVILFHIGVTQAPANGYIFFSQVITIPLQVLVIESQWKLVLKSHKTTSQILISLLLHPYNIWSLDYSRIFNVNNVCLSQSLKSIDVVALEYVSAVYTLIFLIIIYLTIELHARNCRLLVLLWRLCCLPCVRFRKNWQAKTSMIDAFATFIVLSYSKFVRVSITILTPSAVYDDSGMDIDHVVSYDPTIQYFHHDHFPYILLATIILATFGTIPPLLLLLYPLRVFQKCLNHCMQRSHALQTFVDAFQGCYKDGREGGPDRRYFAGLYFIFRIITFALYTLTTSFTTLYACLTATFVIFMLSMLIFQPYKNNFYNCLDGFFFAILAVTSMCNLYIHSTTLFTDNFPKNAFFVSYTLMFIPHIYFVSYIIYWFLVKSRWFQTHCTHRFRRNAGNNINDYIRTPTSRSRSLTSYSEIPDRIENPHRYKDLSHEEIISGATNTHWLSSRNLSHRVHGVTQYGTTTTY